MSAKAIPISPELQGACVLNCRSHYGCSGRNVHGRSLGGTPASAWLCGGLKRLHQPSQSRAAAAGGEAEEAEEDCGGHEGVAGRGVVVVRDDAEEAAQAVRRKSGEGVAAGEGAVALQVEGQFHGVEAAQDAAGQETGLGNALGRFAEFTAK